ncbi:hypothetical protein V6N13_137151 [Hibiscus sabdariffa]|uniref:Benzyl alcohol O-benzoyltransferase n=1 Tax=Hibiscus sabdariffa TaxID=183260 RepID=A0ABR2DLH4_9ROSI
MATPSNTPLVFTIRRKATELVAPAKPSPHEQKLLSDIDDQAGLRHRTPMIFIYQYTPSMEGKDPAKVIREALAQTLVFYYPFAGRLRERANGKLTVDCNDEGVMFMEADADVTLQQLGEILRPPFPCFDELLYDVPDSQGILNGPLLLIQVTRLKCGGFIFALRFHHVICDGTGLKQLLSAMGEMARGLATPSILPVWERHLLDAQDPPLVTFTHHEYEQKEATVTAATLPLDNIVEPYLWRCRTIAINFDPDEEVRLLCVVNARPRFNPPLSSGYYGDVIAWPAAVTTVGNLLQNPLAYAVELIKQAKASVTKEYMKSVAALMTIRSKLVCTPNVIGSYMISDVRNIGFEDIDFGWGKGVFAGPPKAIGWISYFIPTKSKKGEVGTSVPICLPAPAMERFAEELDNMLKNPETEG